VKVSCSEGIANHTGPESCVDTREGAGEALTGERIGQPLSREKSFDPGADALDNAEGNMGGALSRAPSGPAWSQTLACADALCTGTGRSRVWPADGHRWSTSGRRGVVADDAQAREV
jgi:hypothetical protein